MSNDVLFGLAMLGWMLIHPAVSIPALLIGLALAPRRALAIAVGALLPTALFYLLVAWREPALAKVWLANGALWAALGAALGRKLRGTPRWLRLTGATKGLAESVPIETARKGVEL
jgi:hypothetical protein